MIDLDAPVIWTDCGSSYQDIRYHKSACGIARITINRPQVRNAFRPLTIQEMLRALADARFDNQIGVIIFTGEGPDAFCSGGDQKVRGDYGGYRDDEGTHHLNVLDLQRQIRTLPKPVIASVAGYAIGGGHVLHMICDLTIAADNARFGQTGPKVGSFDGGLGSSYLARIVGQKKAREIWYLCRQYDAQQALEIGGAARGLAAFVFPLQRKNEFLVALALDVNFTQGHGLVAAAHQSVDADEEHQERQQAAQCRHQNRVADHARRDPQRLVLLDYTQPH